MDVIESGFFQASDRLRRVRHALGRSKWFKSGPTYMERIRSIEDSIEGLKVEYLGMVEKAKKTGDYKE